MYFLYFNYVNSINESLFDDDLDSNNLLVGKLISQGSVRSEVLGEGTRSQEVKPDQIEEVIVSIC